MRDPTPSTNCADQARPALELLHGGVEILGRDVEDGGAGLLPAGIADYDVQSTKTFHGAIDQFQNRTARLFADRR
jgi:hypothetical protein